VQIIDENDVISIFEASQKAVKRAREGRGPTLIGAKREGQREVKSRQAIS